MLRMKIEIQHKLNLDLSHSHTEYRAAFEKKKTLWFIKVTHRLHV